MKKVSSAVILAAGMGTRLRNVLTDKPKGFIQIDGQPIIQRSIEQLMAVGIDRIVIVTGYQSVYYDTLAKHYPCVQTIKNDLYATSGSMYSLYCARGLIEDTFLLLESDLIYETQALETLMDFSQPNGILLSGWTNSGDEVFVETHHGRIRRLSKRRADLDRITGELVGISKISPALFRAMLVYAEPFFPSDLNMEYEQGCINAIADFIDIFFCKIDDLLWTEVDDEVHLARARQEILPLILKRERNNSL